MKQISNRRDTERRVPIVLLAILMVALVFSGCEGKHKALVSAHKATGEMLVSTKDQVTLLYLQKVIDIETYESIRANWLRAQKSYLHASDLLETILDADSADITSYTELITQVGSILSDIAVWLEEDKR